MYSHLQAPNRFPPKNYLQDLIDFNYKIVCRDSIVCIEYLRDHDANQNSTHILVSLFKRCLSPKCLQEYEISDLYENPEFALIMDCDEAIKSINDVPKYKESFHIMSELTGTYPLQYAGLGTGFPFNEYIHKATVGFVESGIFQKLDQLKNNQKRISLLIEEKSNPKVKIFSMKDLKVAFIIIIVGNLFAILIFLFEYFISLLTADSLILPLS